MVNALVSLPAATSTTSNTIQNERSRNEMIPRGAIELTMRAGCFSFLPGIRHRSASARASWAALAVVVLPCGGAAAGGKRVHMTSNVVPKCQFGSYFFVSIAQAAETTRVRLHAMQSAGATRISSNEGAAKQSIKIIARLRR
jgi:hypothetical protein